MRGKGKSAAKSAGRFLTIDVQHRAGRGLPGCGRARATTKSHDAGGAQIDHLMPPRAPAYTHREHGKAKNTRREPSECGAGEHMSSAESIALRLNTLPHHEVIKLLAEACVASPDLRNRANALVQKHNPLPACAELLSSEDILKLVFDFLQQWNMAAASVCKAWAAAWQAQQTRTDAPRLWRQPLRTFKMPGALAHCNIAVSPAGVVCAITADGLAFWSAQGDELSTGAWATLKAAVPASAHAGDLLVHGNFLFVQDFNDDDYCEFPLRKLRLSDGVELASSPGFGAPDVMTLSGDGSKLFVTMEDRSYIQVHDAGALNLLSNAGLHNWDREGENEWEDECEYDDKGYRTVYALASSGDKIYVASKDKGVLTILGVDGTARRTLQADFRYAQAMVIIHENLYVLEDFQLTQGNDANDFYEQRLLVLDPQSGATKQIVHLSSPQRVGPIHSMCTQGDEVYLAYGHLGEAGKISHVAVHMF